LGHRIPGIRIGFLLGVSQGNKVIVRRFPAPVLLDVVSSCRPELPSQRLLNTFDRPFEWGERTDRSAEKRLGNAGSANLVALSYLFTILEQMTKRDQLGNFELMVIMVLIRLGDNAYGVPICEELEKRTGRDVAVGSVYAALERSEDNGGSPIAS